jgi:hypothetical protein
MKPPSRFTQKSRPASNGVSSGVMSVSERVVDVLEAVHVHVQRRRQGAGGARDARQHLLGAVEYQRAVGQAGERIVQRLVGELACLLAHERQRAGAPGGEQRDQQAEQHPPISTVSACGSASTLAATGAPKLCTVQLSVSAMTALWASWGGTPLASATCEP